MDELRSHLRIPRMIYDPLQIPTNKPWGSTPIKERLTQFRTPHCFKGCLNPRAKVSHVLGATFCSSVCVSWRHPAGNISTRRPLGNWLIQVSFQLLEPADALRCFHPKTSPKPRGSIGYNTSIAAKRMIQWLGVETMLNLPLSPESK